MSNIFEPPQSTIEVSDSDEYKFEKPLYKIAGIGIATFFGTLIAGGFLASRNLKALGRDAEAKKVLIFSTVITIALVTVMFILPEAIVDKIPNSVLNIVQIIAIVQLSKQWFGKDISAYQSNNAKLFSNWRAFGISLLFLLGIIVLISPLFFLYISSY